MNKLLLILSLAFICLNGYAQEIDKKALAVVSKTEGLYVFWGSKPASEYKSLGTLAVTPQTNRAALACGDLECIRDFFIKKIKKEYPLADGLIITIKFPDSFSDTNHTGEAIKLKD